MGRGPKSIHRDSVAIENPHTAMGNLLAKERTMSLPHRNAVVAIFQTVCL